MQELVAVGKISIFVLIGYNIDAYKLNEHKKESLNMKIYKNLKVLILFLVAVTFFACSHIEDKTFKDETYLYSTWKDADSIVAVRVTEIGSTRGSTKDILDTRSDIVLVSTDNSQLDTVIVYDVHITDLAISPSGDYVAGLDNESANDRNVVKVWSVANGNIIKEFNTVTTNVSLDWGNTANRMVVVEATDTRNEYNLRIYDPMAGSLVKAYTGFVTDSKSVYWRWKSEIAFIKNDNLMLIAEDDASPTDTGFELEYTYSYDKDENYIYTIKDDYLVKVDLETYDVTQVASITVGDDRITEIFNDGSKYLVAYSKVQIAFGFDDIWGIFIKEPGDSLGYRVR